MGPLRRARVQDVSVPLRRNSSGNRVNISVEMVGAENMSIRAAALSCRAVTRSIALVARIL